MANLQSATFFFRFAKIQKFLKQWFGERLFFLEETGCVIIER